MRQLLIGADRLQQLGEQGGARNDAAVFDVLVWTVIESADRTEPIETRCAGADSPAHVRASAGRGALEWEAEFNRDADRVGLEPHHAIRPLERRHAGALV